MPAITVAGLINSMLGNDVVLSSADTDEIYGDGHDSIRGEGGSDTFLGGSGDDYVEGWSGSNRIFGGSGRDHKFGSGRVAGEGGAEERGTFYGGTLSTFSHGGSSQDRFYQPRTVRHRGLLRTGAIGLTRSSESTEKDEAATGRLVMRFLCTKQPEDKGHILSGSGCLLARNDAFRDKMNEGATVVREQGVLEGALLVKKLLAFAIVGVLAMTLGGSPARATIASTCDGNVPTIYGSGTINGTAQNDVIKGSTGADVINGGGGHDVICGEGGDDIIDGGTGNDRLFGEVAFSDVLIGTAGSDTIYGGSGDDSIYDYTGTSVISGGAGRDYIVAYGNLSGDGGVDLIYVQPSPGVPSVVNGGTGQDGCSSNPVNGDTEISCELKAD